MKNYIDGFVFPVPGIHLNKYKVVAEKVAEIWKEYGAIAYCEYVGDDLKLKGTRSFVELMDLSFRALLSFLHSAKFHFGKRVKSISVASTN